jgi:hypothetical protein
MVWSSFEDRGSPDIIHNRITRAVDYIAYNSVHDSMSNSMRRQSLS